jgi:hypothetical protein
MKSSKMFTISCHTPSHTTLFTFRNENEKFQHNTTQHNTNVENNNEKYNCYSAISRSSLTGSLSTRIGSLTSLRNFRADYNELIGGMPPLSSSLQQFDVQHNKLSGNVVFGTGLYNVGTPVVVFLLLCDLPMLCCGWCGVVFIVVSLIFVIRLAMAYNNFTGTIPSVWPSQMVSFGISNNPVSNRRRRSIIKFLSFLLSLLVIFSIRRCLSTRSYISTIVTFLTKQTSTITKITARWRQPAVVAAVKLCLPQHLGDANRRHNSHVPNVHDRLCRHRQPCARPDAGVSI